MGRNDAPTMATVDADQPVALQVMGMFNKIGHLMSRPFYRKFISEHDIALAEWRVMVWVQRIPGTTAQDVASRTGMTAMNVSRALASLREKGVVLAERNHADTRRNNLSLTERGHEIFELINPVALADVSRTFSVLTHDELVFLSGLLQRIISNAEALEGELPDIDAIVEASAAEGIAAEDSTGA